MPVLRFLVILALLTGVQVRPVEAARRDVLLVVNSRVPDGKAIADAYRAARDVPESHVVSIDVEPGEMVTRPQYAARIQTPIAEWLHRHAAHDEIVYIVLVRGVPFKVAPDAASRSALVSVDSSLTLLYRTLLGANVGPGQTLNPYFTAEAAGQGWPAFDRQVHDIYLVSRLDGFTMQDALQLPTRCAATPEGSRTVVLDAVPPGATPEHAWFTQAAERIRGIGGRNVSVELDQTRERIRDRQGVVGYYGWGASDASQRERRLPVTLAPGAIGSSLSASDARTLKEPPAAWLPGAWRQPDRVFEGTADGLAGDMVRAGFAGWAGAVADPLVEGLVRPQILFPAYLSGRSLGEAFALATRQLGWRTVVFGDPLCRPFGPEPEPVTFARDERSGLSKPFYDRLLALASRTATRAKPGTLEVQVAARARIQQGDRDRGLGLLRDHIAANPDDVAALQLMALLLDSTKERDEAVKVYRAVLAARPDDIVASNNLAFVLADDPAHREEALGLARRAYERTRGEPTVADTYGWVLFQSGDNAQAVRVLQEAVRRGPNLADAHLHLALAHLKAGQTAEAGTEWAAALRLDAAMNQRPEAAPLVAAFPKP
jgi:uncharacterized protein (TIGR03790 family)